jgi:hypothetical protein
MGVGAGHGHEIKGLEDVKGRHVSLHLQDHLEEDMGKRRLEAELPPVVLALLVDMYSHHGHEPGEPRMNNLTGQVSLPNEPLLHGGKTYA